MKVLKIKPVTWMKVGVIVAVVGFFVYKAYPLEEKVTLGLDLQGGMHLVLEVKIEDALRAERDRVLDAVVRFLKESGADDVNRRLIDDISFEVSGVSNDSLTKVAKWLRDNYPDWEMERKDGLAIFKLSGEGVSRITRQTSAQAEQTIRRRIDAFGVAEPIIQRQTIGVGNRIIVQLPGADDPERIKSLLKKTARLELKLVDSVASTKEELLAQYGGKLPDNLEMIEEDIWDHSGKLVGKRFYALEKQSIITGQDLRNAVRSVDEYGRPAISFTLTPEAGKRFGKFTAENIGKLLAIVLDNKVQSAPEIRARITDQGIITGAFTVEEAEDLATALRAGALPASLVILEERTVGPSLGHDSIRSGVRASAVGLMLVALSMLVFYKLVGFVAIIALVLDIAIMIGALASMGAALTLPGIAGFILTIGMAVDANILIFERIKEELRAGKPAKAAVFDGFNRSWSAIFDANVTTLLAAIILFQFGTGPIKGFAVTLSVGILASLFTAVFVGKVIFEVVFSLLPKVEKIYI